MPSGKSLIDISFIFQHERDAKHTAIAVKAYLDGKIHSGTLSVMNWPPQCPDFDTVEAVDKEYSSLEYFLSFVFTVITVYSIYFIFYKTDEW